MMDVSEIVQEAHYQGKDNALIIYCNHYVMIKKRQDIPDVKSACNS